MNPQDEQERRNTVFGLLAKQQKLTTEEIQILRENAHVAGSDNSNRLRFRMEVELLDSIRKLDESSTKLSVASNWLAAAAIAVAIVGVVVPLVRSCL